MSETNEVKDSAGYISPLPGYIAEAKRDAFLEGARWALDQYLRRARAGDTISEEAVSTAARDYAGLKP